MRDDPAARFVCLPFGFIQGFDELLTDIPGHG